MIFGQMILGQLIFGQMIFGQMIGFRHCHVISFIPPILIGIFW